MKKFSKAALTPETLDLSVISLSIFPQSMAIFSHEAQIISPEGLLIGALTFVNLAACFFQVKDGFLHLLARLIMVAGVSLMYLGLFFPNQIDFQFAAELASFISFIGLSVLGFVRVGGVETRAREIIQGRNRKTGSIRFPPIDLSMFERVDRQVLYRLRYFQMMESGSGVGFAMVFFVEPEKTGRAIREYNEACDVFLHRMFEREDSFETLPDAHHIGSIYKLGGFALLVGHPIKLNEARQIELVKKYVKGGFDCLDEISGGKVKGIVSIAHGVVQFQMPIGLDNGNFLGETWDLAVNVMCDTIYSKGTWPLSTAQHRVAVNESAMKLLFCDPLSEIHRGFAGPSMLMYGADWDESSAA